VDGSGGATLTAMLRQGTALLTLGLLVSACTHASDDPATTPPLDEVEPVVLNDDGGWCWFQDERAIVVGSRLLFGSVAAGTHDPKRRGAVEATTVDLETGVITRARLNDSPIPPVGSYDDHDAPAFVVRGDGRLLAVYAGHGTENRFRYRVSVSPGEATEWGRERSFAPSESSRITYSNLHRLSGESGRIFNFFRGLDDRFKPSVAWSDDGGESWTSGGIVIDVPSEVRHRPYVKYASDGQDTVHLAYTEGHPRDFDNSVYHVMLRRGQLLRSDGTPIGTLAAGLKDPKEGTRVFEGDADNVAWVADLELDSDGRPFVAYSVQRGSAGRPPGEGGEDHRYRLARWTGSRWVDGEIAFAGTRLYAGEDDYTGGVALVPADPDTLFISTNADPVTGTPLSSRSDGRRHWEIFRGVRTGPDRSGRATFLWTPLTRDSTSDNLRPVVPRAPSQKPVVLWLRGAYRSYTDYDLEVVGLPGQDPGGS
jgi:hypothetical protein